MRSLPDPAGGLTAPPRPPAVLHAASGSVGLGHRGSHSPREKPPTKVLHQAPHIGNPALYLIDSDRRNRARVSIASRRHFVFRSHDVAALMGKLRGTIFSVVFFFKEGFFKARACSCYQPLIILVMILLNNTVATTINITFLSKVRLFVFR